MLTQNAIMMNLARCQHSAATAVEWQSEWMRTEEDGISERRHVSVVASGV